MLLPVSLYIHKQYCEIMLTEPKSKPQQICDGNFERLFSVLPKHSLRTTAAVCYYVSTFSITRKEIQPPCKYEAKIADCQFP